MACFGLYEFHLLHGLPGYRLSLVLYEKSYFGSLPSPVPSTSSCISSSVIHRDQCYFFHHNFFPDPVLYISLQILKSHFCHCNFCMSPHRPAFASIWQRRNGHHLLKFCVSFRVFPLNVPLIVPYIFWNVCILTLVLALCCQHGVPEEKRYLVPSSVGVPHGL